MSRKRFWAKPGLPYSIRFGGSAMPELGRAQQTRRVNFDVMQLPGKAELAKRHAQQPQITAVQAARQTIAMAQVLGQQTLAAAHNLIGAQPRDTPTGTKMAGAKLVRNGLKVAGRQIGIVVPETWCPALRHLQQRLKHRCKNCWPMPTKKPKAPMSLSCGNTVASLTGRLWPICSASWHWR
jgi:hypothetical protein